MARLAAPCRTIGAGVRSLGRRPGGRRSSRAVARDTHTPIHSAEGILQYCTVLYQRVQYPELYVLRGLARTQVQCYGTVLQRVGFRPPQPRPTLEPLQPAGGSAQSCQPESVGGGGFARLQRAFHLSVA